MDSSPSTAVDGIHTCLGKGNFSGRTLRFSMEVAQHPTIGRKSTVRDRRPIASIPIVRLRIYDVETNEELDEEVIERLDLSNLMCSVDLHAPFFSTETEPRSDTSSTGTTTTASTSATSILSNSANIEDIRPGYSVASSSRAPPMDLVMSAVSISSLNSKATSSELEGEGSPSRQQEPRYLLRPRLSSSYILPSPSFKEPPRRSHFVLLPKKRSKSGSFTSRTSSTKSQSDNQSSETAYGSTDAEDSSGSEQLAKVQRNLLGALYVTAVAYRDLEGTLGIWFMFHDVAVRSEGVYTLQFAAFDCSAETQQFSTDVTPILAWCYSKPFTVYSPRTHPGNPVVSDLGKHFLSQGYKAPAKKETSDTAGTYPRGLKVKPLTDGDFGDVDDDEMNRSIEHHEYQERAEDEDDDDEDEEGEVGNKFEEELSEECS
ncbi:Velvet factor [Phaffia rhodozyma]|uniref:Velvet factor n=1 Tax=Phaffia rhodozyma TaxID=264483 RepID=A0A0F7STF2_PHARH|nr:Velvet factor [Phaffia rhodozyma]